MKSLLLLVFSVLLLQSFAKDAEKQNPQLRFEEIAPSDYVTINKRKYYVNTVTLRTALQAMSECNDLDMVLATFETPEEYLAVSRHVADLGFSSDHFWTSGERWMDVWRWSATGRFFAFSEWFSGEPNGAPSAELCVYFCADQGWRDDPCLAAKNFVCEQS